MNRKSILVILFALVMLLGIAPAANATTVFHGNTYYYGYESSDYISIEGETVTGFPPEGTEWELPAGKAFLGWVDKNDTDMIYFPEILPEGEDDESPVFGKDLFALFAYKPTISMNNPDTIFIDTRYVMVDLGYDGYTGEAPVLTEARLLWLTDESSDPEVVSEIDLTEAGYYNVTIAETGSYYCELTYTFGDKEVTVASDPLQYYAKPNLTISATLDYDDVYDYEVMYVTVKITAADGNTLFGEHGDVYFFSDGHGSATIKPGDLEVEVLGLPGIYGELTYEIYVDNTNENNPRYEVCDPYNAENAIVTGTIDPSEGVEHTVDINISKLRADYSFEVVNDGGDETDVFNVTFTANDIYNDSLYGTYGDVEFENGEATVQIKGGETINITDLPAASNVEATVEEKVNYEYTATVNGEVYESVKSGIDTDFLKHGVGAEVVLTAAYTETYADLRLGTVEGDVEEGDTLTFTIELKDRNGNPVTEISTQTSNLYGYGDSVSETYKSETGIYEIAAQPDTWFEILDLPYNTYYNVTQTGVVPENGGNGELVCELRTGDVSTGYLTEVTSVYFTPEYKGEEVYLTFYDMVRPEWWPSDSKFRVGRVIEQLPAANNDDPTQKQIGWRDRDNNELVYSLDESFTVPAYEGTEVVAGFTYEAVWMYRTQLNITLAAMGEFVPEDAEFTVNVQVSNENEKLAGETFSIHNAAGTDVGSITFDANGNGSFTMSPDHPHGETMRVIYDLPTGTEFTVTISAPETVGPEKYTATSDETVNGVIPSPEELGYSAPGYANFSYTYYNEFVVTFDPGNGDEAETKMVTTDYPYVVIPDGNELTEPDGKVFDGWKDAEGILYCGNDTVYVTGDTTFTANWRERADGGYTVTVHPGYILDADGKYQDVSGETYTFPKEGEAGLFMGDRFIGRVQVAGEYGAESAEYTYNAPEGTGLLRWEYSIERNGTEVESGNCGTSIDVTVKGDVDIYPVYAEKFDITLDYAKEDIANEVISGHISGTALTVLGDHRYEGLHNGSVHNGWFIDSDGDNNYDYTTSDVLLWDFSSDYNYYTEISKADLAATGNTITAWWEDGFTITYKDVVDGETFEYTEAYSGYYATIKSPEDVFSGMDGWTAQGEFDGWLDEYNNRGYHSGQPYDKDSYGSLTLTAQWYVEPLTLYINDDVTDTNHTGTGNEVEVYDGFIGLTAGVNSGTIPDGFAYMWTVTPMEDGAQAAYIHNVESIDHDSINALFGVEYDGYHVELSLYNNAGNGNVIEGTDYIAALDVIFVQESTSNAYIGFTMDGVEFDEYGEATVTVDKLENGITATLYDYEGTAGWHWQFFDYETNTPTDETESFLGYDSYSCYNSLTYQHDLMDGSTSMKIVVRAVADDEEIARGEVVLHIEDDSSTTEPDGIEIWIWGDTYVDTVKGMTNAVYEPAWNEYFYSYSTGDVSGYNTYWTLTPVDADGNNLTDDNDDEIGVIWDYTGNFSYDWYVNNSDLKNAANGYEYVRLTLAMKDEYGNVYENEDGTEYRASFIIRYPLEYSIVLQALDADGNDVGLDNAFTAKQNITLKPVLYYGKDVADADVEWQWDVIGQNRDHDNGWSNGTNGDGIESADYPYLDSVPVADIIAMDAAETQWSVRVTPYKEKEGETYRDAFYFDINVSAYDHTASISATDADGDEADLNDITHASDVTFTASIQPVPEGDYSWVWTAMSDGYSSVLNESGKSVDLADIVELNQYITDWTLSVHAVDENGDQITDSENVSFGYPYPGGFQLYIKAGEYDEEDRYIEQKYYGTGNTGEMTGNTSLKPGYVGEMPEGDYKPVWTVTALDESGDPIEGSATEVDFWFEDWYSYDSVWADTIRNAVNDEYATHEKLRITLTLADSDGNEVTDGMASVDMTVPVIYYVDITVTDNGGNVYEDLDDIEFSKNDDITFTPSISPAVEGVSWTWRIQGGWYEDEDYNEYYAVDEYIENKSTLSLADIVALNSTESEWKVSAMAMDGVKVIEDTYVYVYVNPYDYNASITPKLDGDDIDLEENYYFENNAGLTFTASLDGEPAEYDWVWVVYGDYNHEVKNTGDTIELSEITACEPQYDGWWNIRAYAVDADGNQISTMVSESFRTYYDGDFYVMISPESSGVVWTKAGNTHINSGFGDSYESNERGEFDESVTEGFNTYDYYPLWTIYALNADGAELASGYVKLEWWDDTLTRERINNAMSGTGYSTDSHSSWKLVLSVMDDNGVVYDPQNTTDYMAEVIVDSTVYVKLSIYDNDSGDEYAGTAGRIEADSDHWFYPIKNEAEVEGYSYPRFTVTPAGTELTGLVVETIGSGWGESGGYISMAEIKAAAEAAGGDYPDYDTWVIRLEIVDENGIAYDKPDYARDMVELTVEFTDWESDSATEDDGYMLVLTDESTDETYSSEPGEDNTTYSLELPADAKSLTLSAAVLFEDEECEDVTISWAWVGTDENGDTVQNPQGEMTTGESYNFSELLAKTGDNGLVISVTGFVGYDPETEASEATAGPVQINVSIADSEPGPGTETENSGVKFYVNDSEYASGSTYTANIGDTVTIYAEGFGDADGYAIAYTVDDESMDAESLSLTYPEPGTHTIYAMAYDATSEVMAADMDNGDGTFTGTLTLVIAEDGAADPSDPSDPYTGAGEVLVDPSVDDPNNPTQINVTGILKSNPEEIEPDVYSVELTWGAMAFEYARHTDTTVIWDPVTHTEEVKNDVTTHGWRLRSEEDLTLPSGADNVIANADQSYVVVFNHSNRPVDVSMSQSATATSYGVTASLSHAAGATGNGSGNLIEYTLGRGVEGTRYTAGSGAAAKVQLSGVPQEGISTDTDAPSVVAKLTVTISRAAD